LPEKLAEHQIEIGRINILKPMLILILTKIHQQSGIAYWKKIPKDYFSQASTSN
jgi:hypothetical protein